MSTSYEELFNPIFIGKLRIRNRFVMAPMHTRYASESGAVTDQMVAYHVARAEGGVGLIILENTCVSWELGRAPGNPVAIHEEVFKTGLSTLVTAVHRHGVKMVTQLQHTGRQNLRGNTTGGQPPIAPSAVQSKVGGDMPRAMTGEDIEKAIQQFVDGARRSKEAGFDGVEIHGAHGYLPNQFFSPLTNHRLDKWGGSFENRCRFIVEIIRRLRAEVGPDFPLLYRFSADEKVQGGYGLEEGVRLAKVLEREGVNALDVSAGIYESMPWVFLCQGTPAGALLPLAAAVRAEVKIPVIAVGGLGWDPVLANEAIRNGRADMVSLGRSLLCDPDLPNKIREDKIHQIRRCIRCNDCVGFIFPGKALACILNPELGNEYKELVRPSSRPERIVVVGAGAAGLEYALTAARRGHRVTVLEQADRIGGQIHVAAKPAHKKEELHHLVSYFEAMIKKWGIDVRLGVAATPDTVSEFDPDRVILAVGSKPKKISVPGGQLAKSAVEVLQNEAGGLGKRIGIIGGDGVGIDTALYLQEKGREVILLEMRPDIGMSLNFPIAWQFKEMLAKGGAKVLTRHEVVAIDEEGITAKTEGATVKIRCDDVVAAVGFDTVPTGDLEEALRKKGFEVAAAGTCVKPGRLYDAIHSGFFAALKD